MKIFHVTPAYYPAIGGAEVHAKEICERLVRRGHDVTVLTMTGLTATADSLAGSEVINGVNVHRFRPATRLQDLFNGLLGLRGAHRLLDLTVGTGNVQMLATGPYSTAPLRSSLRSNPDVVAVSNWYCASLAYQMCLARHLRRFSLVGIPLFHTERPWSESPLYTRMLDRCDAVAAMTAHERSFIELRSKRTSVHVVGVGVDPSLFASANGKEIRQRYRIGDAPLVGYVGRMVPTKGVATLIAAMRIVWRTDSTVRLLLAGAGLPTAASPDNEVGRALADLSDAERPRIVIVGRFDDDQKASIYDALDVFAMPSIAESFGIAYLEAWMCKKPVIGARNASTQCVIEDGVDGLLVTAADPAKLADSILCLLSTRDTRERMGRHGWAKTIAGFTWANITDKIESIYAQAHASTGTGAARIAPVQFRART